MKKCIYCKQDKKEGCFSLEHIIPQFLGGAQAPDYLKTRNVCKTCNSNLGLFVDAAFEKDWLVFNELNESAYACFNPKSPTPLPLRNMGNSDLVPPGMGENDICECWLGPFGEQVYWVRPKDERMYWYAGGNPRTAKQIWTRAYFMFADRSQKAPHVTWLTFKDVFAGRKVKKLMVTEIVGADPKNIGFSDPDQLDSVRVEYFKKVCRHSTSHTNHFSMYLNFDIRFMAKLAIGLSHVLFNGEFDDNDYSKELLKTLWYKEGDVLPHIEGCSNLGNQNIFLKDQCGIANAVTISILPIRNRVAVNLNINRKMNWVVNCVKMENMSIKAINRLKDGICIILFKYLNKGVEISLPELIAHNAGNVVHRKLANIEAVIGTHKDYFKNI